MNSHKHPFENIIKEYIVHTEDHYLALSSRDKEADFVFNDHYSYSLSHEKKQKFLASLNELFSKDSLGKLIQKSLSDHSATSDQLMEKTGMPVSLQQSILEDMVFPNSIPIKSLVRLLKYLNIPVKKAIQSIEKTYQILTTEKKIFNSVPGEILPSFRHGQYSGDDYGVYNVPEAKISSYLYQNKEALEKYINRLEELYFEV